MRPDGDYATVGWGLLLRVGYEIARCDGSHLRSERGVAVQEQREDARPIDVLQAQLLGTGEAHDEGADRLKVRRVWEEREVERASVGHVTVLRHAHGRTAHW